MKYRNILVPYDGSDSARKALVSAFEFAGETPGAKVTAFFAAPLPQFETQDFMIASYISGNQPMTPEQTAEMQKKYLQYHRDQLTKELGEVIDSAGDLLTVAVGQGKPSKAILDYAAAHKCDLIVMGSRGLNAVAGMLGSVSYAVLRNAECPVLVER